MNIRIFMDLLSKLASSVIIIAAVLTFYTAVLHLTRKKIDPVSSDL